MLFNVISYKFCKSKHTSNQIKKDILKVYPYILFEELVLSSRKKKVQTKMK